MPSKSARAYLKNNQKQEELGIMAQVVEAGGLEFTPKYHHQKESFMNFGCILIQSQMI
jgi:hypothetical protein